MALTENDVIAVLRDCYDPELPLNIVDLGLIYRVKISADAPDLQQNDRQHVEVEMTLTTPGCPAHSQISQEVKDRIEQLPGVDSAVVHVVWSPRWTPERLTEAARIKLATSRTSLPVLHKLGPELIR